jgi:hypothetical protein
MRSERGWAPSKRVQFAMLACPPPCSSGTGPSRTGHISPANTRKAKRHCNYGTLFQHSDQ